MEIIPEGKNFRLVLEHELPEIMAVLEQYMPEALKVSVRQIYVTVLMLWEWVWIEDFSKIEIGIGWLIQYGCYFIWKNTTVTSCYFLQHNKLLFPAIYGFRSLIQLNQHVQTRI